MSPTRITADLNRINFHSGITTKDDRDNLHTYITHANVYTLQLLHSS